MTLAESHQRRFEVLREIASGGFGSVFLCRVHQTDGFSRVTAVKLLHPQWSENEEVASRMRDEARLLGLLRHRNIVDVVDLTRLDGRVAVVMEYLEAVDLKTILRGGARMPVTAVLQLGAQVASALDAAFNKAPVEGEKPLRVVHRDIKPSNIMVDAQGTAKVLDFGVARGEFEAREAETRGMAFGSFDYMPPERRFMEPGGETSDVYSLGAVLFELLLDGTRLGKGKLKPDEHAEFVKDRATELHAGLSSTRGHTPESMPNPRSVDELSAFIASMLAFEEDARPTPSQVTSVLRRLARAFRDGSLDEWAEIHVPPLLARARATQDKGKADPLVGQVLVEERDWSSGGTSEPPQDAPSASSASNTPRPARRPPPPSSPAALGKTPSTTWEQDAIDYMDIPKRVRDAAPSRPSLTGTQTPAPLRRAARRTPQRRERTDPTDPARATASVEPRPVAEEPARPSTLSTVLYVGVWLFGLFVLAVGAIAMLVVSWYVGQG